MDGKLACGSAVGTATVFAAASGAGDALANGGAATWYASAVPSGSTQVGVETAMDGTSLTIRWVGS